MGNGGGWRIRGGGYRGDGAKARRVGCRYIHTAIDACSRIAYSEILDDEQGDTAADFWLRAARWWIKPRRVITDNRSCYRSNK